MTRLGLLPGLAGRKESGENDLMMEAFKDMPYRRACQGKLYWLEPMSTPKVENTKFFFLSKEGPFTDQ
jgi:hypothetical protein